MRCVKSINASACAEDELNFVQQGALTFSRMLFLFSSRFFSFESWDSFALSSATCAKHNFVTTVLGQDDKSISPARQRHTPTEGSLPGFPASAFSSFLSRETAFEPFCANHNSNFMSQTI
jgi:hypothetical protein